MVFCCWMVFVMCIMVVSFFLVLMKVIWEMVINVVSRFIVMSLIISLLMFGWFILLGVIFILMFFLIRFIRLVG